MSVPPHPGFCFPGPAITHHAPTAQHQATPTLPILPSPNNPPARGDTPQPALSHPTEQQPTAATPAPGPEIRPQATAPIPRDDDASSVHSDADTNRRCVGELKIHTASKHLGGVVDEFERLLHVIKESHTYVGRIDMRAIDNDHPTLQPRPHFPGPEIRPQATAPIPRDDDASSVHSDADTNRRCVGELKIHTASKHLGGLVDEFERLLHIIKESHTDVGRVDMKAIDNEHPTLQPRPHFPPIPQQFGPPK